MFSMQSQIKQFCFIGIIQKYANYKQLVANFKKASTNTYTRCALYTKCFIVNKLRRKFKYWVTECTYSGSIPVNPFNPDRHVNDT